MRVNEGLVVAVDFSDNEDEGVLIVGRMNDGTPDIINAFQGKEAMELYLKLTTVTKGKVE